ncbi:molybdopterin-dependent oxidoreductase [Marinomonas primoryensis]|jgi:hypothetical protein|uniref:molybdopterin-dependent oxidoreductase n=1 Tax=Marinomonas primoryensis TaxID=178399 RepID=UPI0030DDD0D5
MKSYSVVILISFGLTVFSSLQAKELSIPTGRVILTVTGAISNTNTANKTAEFDRQMLMDLDVITQQTETPWTEGIDTYKGPLLRSLLAVVGAKSDTLFVQALNDYNALVPVQDSYDYNLILAMEMNGKPMGVRNKGPLFLLYPFKESPELNNEVIHNRSVWQIKAINVE